MAEDVPAVAVMATIVASNDLSEDVVYAFVKGLFDYKADITAAHVKGAELDLDTAVSGVSSGKAADHPASLSMVSACPAFSAVRPSSSTARAFCCRSSSCSA